MINWYILQLRIPHNWQEIRLIVLIIRLKPICGGIHKRVRKQETPRFLAQNILLRNW